MAEQPGYVVFEIVNEKRREIYVGATRDPIFQMTDALRRQPPHSIQHWNFEEVGAVRSIEFNMGEKDARAFIANYIQTGLSKDWKFLT